MGRGQIATIYRTANSSRLLLTFMLLFMCACNCHKYGETKNQLNGFGLSKNCRRMKKNVKQQSWNQPEQPKMETDNLCRRSIPLTISTQPKPSSFLSLFVFFHYYLSPSISLCAQNSFIYFVCISKSNINYSHLFFSNCACELLSSLTLWSLVLCVYSIKIAKKCRIFCLFILSSEASGNERFLC